jgi:hypothetical protein
MNCATLRTRSIGSTVLRCCFTVIGALFVAEWQSTTVEAIDPRCPLTEKAARQAILKLRTCPKAPITFSVPDPPNAERKGCWYCDLKNKRFWIVYEEGNGSHFTGGKFEPSAGDSWTARITFSKTLQRSLGPLGILREEKRATSPFPFPESGSARSLFRAANLALVSAIAQKCPEAFLSSFNRARRGVWG